MVFVDMEINQRSERLDQIVGEVEGILFAGMEQADGRMQAMSDQATGDGPAKDSVAVVKCCVCPAFFGTVEALAE